MDRITALDHFLRAFDGPSSFFFLGAGVSHPIIPMAAQLGSIVLREALALGHYPTERVQLDPVAERIVGSARAAYARGAWDVDARLRLDLMHRIAAGAVKALAISHLNRGVPEGPCPQYEVFQRAAHSGTILNFNNDGLASALCTRHLVLNAHGSSLSPAVRGALGWETLADQLQMFPSLDAPSIPGLLLPQREPATIRGTAPFQAAFHKIRMARHVAVIGYSFGELDDHVAFDMLTATRLHAEAAVAVVGPNVAQLTAVIAETMKSNRVYGLTAYWRPLAMAVIAVEHQPYAWHKSCNQWRCPRCIDYAYNALLDAGANE
jgi:hypothetical protein